MGLWEWLTRNSHTSPRGAVSDGAPSADPSEGFAVIDVETTGLSPARHRIVEIAVVQTDVRGNPLKEWSTRINPQGPVGATHIHGITAADVKNSPEFAAVIPHLISQLQGRVIVAHNASFDVAFLAQEFARASWLWPETPSLCTMREASYFLPQLHRRRLIDCCEVSGIRIAHAHSALGDARATSVLLRSYLDERFGPPPLAQHLQLPKAAHQTVWPLEPMPPGTVAPHAKPAAQRASQHFHRSAAHAKAPVKVAVSLLSQVGIREVLGSGVPDYTVGYIEALLSALEDGALSEEEIQALEDLANGMRLDEGDVHAVRLGVAHALAAAAVEDGTISKAERSELKQVLVLLGFEEKEAAGFLNDARRNRCERLSTGLPPLPEQWKMGEPLHVGDNVVFTGCDPQWRTHFEAEAHRRGVQVASGVSKKTAMLVSDGSFSGTKADKAAALGTRVVQPRHFEMLLQHIQPHVD